MYPCDADTAESNSFPGSRAAHIGWLSAPDNWLSASDWVHADRVELVATKDQLWFQMFPTLIKQINTCRIFDFWIRNHCIHDQGSNVRREISFAKFSSELLLLLPFLGSSSFRFTFRIFSGHLPVQMNSFTLATNTIGIRFRKCTIMEASKRGSIWNLCRPR